MQEKKLAEWECHQRKKRGVKCERAGLQEVLMAVKLKQLSKYIIFAFLFDYIHYDLWVFFPEHLQLYAYDATQSLAFLFYIYAVYKLFYLFKEYTPIMYAISSLWLWFSVGDVVTIIYSTKTLEALQLEHCCMGLNMFVLSYKYRDNLRLYFELFRFNLNIDTTILKIKKHERITFYSG